MILNPFSPTQKISPFYLLSSTLFCLITCFPTQVEENADSDDIRRRYHRLALQLHPDKNNHPKAEIAFKLILQGYSVLSDDVKRRQFDCERKKCFCIECNRIPYSSPKVKESIKESRSRDYRIRQALKDIRERFKEEARVMENCLKVNASSSSRRDEAPVFVPSSSSNQSLLFRCRSRRESPVFDPCNYGAEGYPHFRERSFSKKPESFWNMQRRQSFSNNGQGSRTSEVPVFENRLDRGILKSKPACVHS
ncbi:unnamed protein product [Linum tenue]|uniref:J domain-containing protein n=1 Tax=Linum tenue TaxID=586396 RepID=A0AAV0P9G8_9ROSI|nr:unnamed protein product [Linum tenue]